MEVKILEKKEYDTIIRTCDYSFNKSDFCELNRDKVQDIQYWGIFKETSPRYAFPVGIKNNEVKCPFSAPFGYPVATKKNLSIDNYHEALVALENHCKNIKYNSISFFLPPLIYDEAVIGSWINAFVRNKWDVEYVDVNYSCDLETMHGEHYTEFLNTNARRNLKLAKKEELQFIQCHSEEENKEAYDVILQNRIAKGYPLRMTYKQVAATMKIIDSSMYLIKKGNLSIAAALVYNINNEVSQLIYWGDIPEYSRMKPINFLAEKLNNLYYENGVKIFDLGPATEDGIPNVGLCDFKDSVGAKRTIKFKVRKNFNE